MGGAHPGGLRDRALAASSLLLALALAGCGGGTRQDASEPSGSFKVKIVKASFPRSQGLAQSVPFTVTVRNTGDRAVPDLAMTVDGFADEQSVAGAADPSRPLWVVDKAPAGVTAYANTWTLGRLPAGGERTFAWSVTATQPGTHTLRYRVAAGLNGKARAVTDNDGVPEGSVTVRVTRKPRTTIVDPETGAVVVQDVVGGVLPGG